MGYTRYNNNNMITLTVITLSGFNCIFNNFTSSSPFGELQHQLNALIINKNNVDHKFCLIVCYFKIYFILVLIVLEEN